MYRYKHHSFTFNKVLSYGHSLLNKLNRNRKKPSEGQ